MQIIKDKQIIEDDWSYLSEKDELQDGNITMSISCWKTGKDQFINHKGKLGIRIEPDDTVADIADDLKTFQLIELNFPVFTDGRCFSHARMLRSLYRYEGELRAVGQFLRDQVFYLSRVGCNSFKLENPNDLPGVIESQNEFSVKYQASTN